MLSNAAKNMARVSAKAFSKSVINRAAAGKGMMPLVTRSMSTLQEKGMSEETKYIRQQEAAAMKKKLDEILEKEGNEEEVTEMKKILGNLNEICYYIFLYSLSPYVHAFVCVLKHRRLCFCMKVCSVRVCVS